MDALEALQSRVSVSRPGFVMPCDEVLENIYAAALRAPDHAQMRPWRFLSVAGDARHDLADLFVEAQLVDNPSLDQQSCDKIRAKTLRAPLIVIAIASPKQHEKVPQLEQLLSAAAAVQNMLLAAHAQDAAAIWRTGSMAYHNHVLRGLGLKSDEHLIAYLYIGSAPEKRRQAPKMDIKEYFCPWSKQS